MGFLPYNAGIWFPGYLRSLRRRGPAPRSVLMVIADHYEPWNMHRNGDPRLDMVERWCVEWPKIARRHLDADGRPPQYGFFYPVEQYEPAVLEALAEVVRAGYGDVEVHLHHENDTEAGLVRTMRQFLETLHARHGLLHVKDGIPQFAFIHGNWALDNSRPDGKYCGLNNEIALLKQLGCYADFTLPSAPHATQTRTVNEIYWATDDPLRPKSHDCGTPVHRGCSEGDLLIVPGPLGFNFRGGRVTPRLETGEIAWYDPPVAGRAGSWLDLAPRIGTDIFLKVFTHGAQPKNADALLNGGLDLLFEDMSAECRRRNLELHYATPWQMRLQIDRWAGSNAAGVSVASVRRKG
jgi:hypothetical protein